MKEIFTLKDCLKPLQHTFERAPSHPYQFCETEQQDMKRLQEETDEAEIEQ